MNDFKGTPGPWMYVVRNVNELMTTFHGVTIGDTYIEAATRNEGADAILISAAPELLEALQELVHADTHGIKNCSAQVNALEKAKSAIAKALGK